MTTRVGATPAYVLSQLTTAVVGAACFVASIGFINQVKTALFQPVLSVSPSQFSWIGNVNFDFNHDSVIPAQPNTPNIDALVVTNVDQALKKISKLEVRAKLERKNAFTRVSQAAKRAKLAQERKRQLEIAEAESDRVALTQAAPIPTGDIPAPEVSEEERIQLVHQVLLSQFKLAMNDLPIVPTATQVALAVTTQPSATSDLGLDGVPGAPQPPKNPGHHAVIATQIKQEEKSEDIPAPQALPAAPDDFKGTTDTVHLSASAEQPAAKVADSARNPQELAKIAAVEKLAQQLSGDEEIPTPPVDEPMRQFQITSNTQINAPPTLDEPPAAVTVPSQPQPQAHAEAKSEAVSFMGGTLILPTEYPNQKPKTEYPHSNTVAMNTHPQPSAGNPALPHTGRDPMTDADESPAPQTPARTPSTANPASMMMSAAIQPSIVSTLNSAPVVEAPVVAPVKASFVEAFDWTHAVSDAQAEILTREDAFEAYGQAQVGWRIAKSADHWSTVYWNHSGEIPLLSKTSAKMLSLKAAASLQSEAGIVIAKAPAGWSLEFAGRSEHPLVFNSTNQLLANDSVEEERYYVFLNASPGAQILYLVKSGETGALTIPVFGGTLSYADLSQPEKRELSGKILDAGGKQVRAVSGMRVQLIGSGQTTVTNGSGAFKFENVISFGNQPLYVEAELGRGYPHRYKVNPKSPKLSLFLMSEEQVHDWVGQLEGGISTESGLIIGAIPTVASANEEKKPLPSIRTLATDPTLVPETYTMSPAGQLLVKTPMSAANARLIGVQVPEGPAIVQLTDKDGRVLWSELLVVSPRVLSVIGPY